MCLMGVPEKQTIQENYSSQTVAILQINFYSTKMYTRVDTY